MPMRRALVVAVEGCPDLGLAADAGASDAGQDRRGDVVAEGQERGDGAGGVRRDVVAPPPEPGTRPGCGPAENRCSARSGRGKS
jgi:hypothetical protein